ncbi:MAG: hypothetical protein R3C14_34095 [Caldilineaceae bacterium]
MAKFTMRPWLKLEESTSLWQCSLLTASLYLAIACFVLPPNALWSPDEGAKLLQLESLSLKAGKFIYQIDYPGRTVDPEFSYAPTKLLRVREKALYFQRLPLWPLLMLPFYALGGAYGLYLLPALGGVLCCVFMLMSVKPAQRRLSMWLMAAFGTPLLIYSTIFWEHTVATALALAGATFTLQDHYDPKTFRHPASSKWLIGGLLFALASFLRLEVILFVFAWLCADWWLRPSGRRGIWICGALVGTALVLYALLHRLLFAGQSLPDNATYLFYPLFYLRSAQWRALPDLLLGPPTGLALDTGLLGAIWSGCALGALILGWTGEAEGRLRPLYLLALGCLTVISGLFLFVNLPYRTGHGLFFTAPWAVVGLCRVRRLWRDGDERARLIVLCTLIGLGAYAVAILGFRASSPQGGLEWGARFALTFYPLLTLMALWPLAREVEDSRETALVGLLLLLGIGFQIRGLGTIYVDKMLSRERNAALLAAPTAQIVSDLWWLPYDSAMIYPARAFYSVDTPTDVVTWAVRAQRQQVEHFTFVTTRNPLPPDLVAARPNGPVLEVEEYKYVAGVFLYTIRIAPAAHTTSLRTCASTNQFANNPFITGRCQ